jgi:hypothetical protein
VGALALLRSADWLLVLCNWAVTLAVGFAYAFLASRDGAVRPLDGAVGGALATATAGLIGALVSACLLIAAPFALAQGQALNTSRVLAGVAVPLLRQLCLGPFGGAVAGAISGLVGAVTVGRSKS